MTTSDEFLELDLLLAQETARATAEETARAARTALRAGPASEAERARLRAIVEAWELTTVWQPVANAALWRRESCVCGATPTVSWAGLFTRLQHRQQPATQEWRATAYADALLPNEVAFQDISVPVCAACAMEKGWDLASGESRLVAVSEAPHIINLT